MRAVRIAVIVGLVVVAAVTFAGFRGWLEPPALAALVFAALLLAGYVLSLVKPRRVACIVLAVVSFLASWVFLYAGALVFYRSMDECRFRIPTRMGVHIVRTYDFVGGQVWCDYQDGDGGSYGVARVPFSLLIRHY